MAWATPPTFTSGNVLTAAQLNIISSNLNETAPAKAAGQSQIFVSTGVNSLVARTFGYDVVAVAETTTATSFTDLATVGPQATVTSSQYSLAFMQSAVQNNTSGLTSNVGLDVSGATTAAAAAIYISILTGAANNALTAGAIRMIDFLTAGSNTFTMKYQVGGGTGTFNRRYMTIMPL